MKINTQIQIKALVLLTSIVLFGCPSLLNQQIINIAAIPGVIVPSVGATPITTITETDQYTGTVTWNDNPEIFAASTIYTATITLTAKTGYTLGGIEENFFSVDGAAATNPVNSGIVTAVFPETGADVVSISDIPGVIVPSVGATPITTITETDQYTGTVTWNDNPEIFAASTIYTATITLTAKTGYTLGGIEENFFSVDGAAATNPVNSGIVTAVFPETGDMIINLAFLTGIPIPVAGKTPVTSIAETNQFTGSIEWQPVIDDVFIEGIEYTAKITLNPKKYFTFIGINVDFFIVLGAVSTNMESSGIVQAVFPVTKSENDTPWYFKYNVTAHAGGGIISDSQKYTYTNSKEAILESYSNGIRVFEVDLMIIDNGVPVLVHDWNGYSGITSSDISEEEFKKEKIYGKFEPLTLEDLISLMTIYEDMYIDLDAKARDPKVWVPFLRECDENILNRIIIEFYNEDNFFAIETEYHFSNYMYSVYSLDYRSSNIINNVIDFCNQYNISLVCYPAYSSYDLTSDLVKNFFYSGIYAVAHGDKADNVDSFNYLKKIGVIGLQSDWVTQEMWDNE